MRFALPIRVSPTYGHVYGDHCEADEGHRVEPFCSLRPVTQGQQETHDQQTQIHVFKDDIQNVDAIAELEGRVFH